MDRLFHRRDFGIFVVFVIRLDEVRAHFPTVFENMANFLFDLQEPVSRVRRRASVLEKHPISQFMVRFRKVLVNVELCDSALNQAHENCYGKCSDPRDVIKSKLLGNEGHEYIGADYLDHVDGLFMIRRRRSWDINGQEKLTGL